MSEIFIGDNDRLESALKAFRRKVQKSGVLKELRQKRFYVKPSMAKRQKIAAALRRKAERRHGRGHGGRD